MEYPRWDIAAAPIRCKGCKLPIPPGADVYIKSKSVYYCNTCGPLAEAAGSDVSEGGMEEAFLNDLATFPDEAADTVLAKTTRYMARQLDCGEVSPREVPTYTKEIRINLLQLRDLYPPAGEEDDTETRQKALQERRRREQGGM